MPKRLIPTLILACLLFVLPFTVSSYVRDKATQITSPLATYLTRQGLAINDFFRGIGQISHLRQDRTELQEEVFQLRSQVVEDEKYRRENDQLRQELGITGIVRETPKVAAHIIMYGNTANDRTFVIDVGTTDGVHEGQALVQHGFLIGRVIESRNHSAIVRSIFSPKSIIQAVIPLSGEKGLVIGDGNTATLQEISQGVAVAENSAIETSGLGGSLPRGIPVGQTGTALSQPSDLSQSFRINLGSDPNNLETLMVLLTEPPQ